MSVVELANSNKPEEEETSTSYKECKSNSSVNSESQCVNNNDGTDENSNPSINGDKFITFSAFYFL